MTQLEEVSVFLNFIPSSVIFFRDFPKIIPRGVARFSILQ